ncbi:MAG TPA: RNA polymerase sigma-70 factor [Acidimicrobiia bacterium]|nr:RNA polymerase sigma-70 factor [Acidimicrobiia bacterium]
MSNLPDSRADETDVSLRPLLFSIAYRMTGSVTDAEDLVQETYVRVHAAERDGTQIESRRAYACAVVTRLAIDYLRSARVRREEYVGEWLPEPIVTDRSADPEQRAELSDSLSMAFLVLLERLTPSERAVLLLRDVFGYGFDEVAELIDKSEAACRQLAVRAREKVQDGKPRFETSVEKRWALAERFFAAVERGDTEGLADMLAQDVVLYGDGGGKAPARRAPLRGMSETVRFLGSFSPRADREGWALTLVDVNGQPGAVVSGGDGATVAVVSLDVAMGKVQAVRAVVNPDKLGHLAEAPD